MDVGGLIDGRALAITGGTGTLGNALVTEIMSRYHPRRVVIISRSESRQAEMKHRWPEVDGSPMRYFVGDIRSYDRLVEAFEGVQIIVHAAALKRIDTCEREVKEAVLTNVIGTLNAAEAARQCGAERFLYISSDKATNACTLYGGTKYLAERVSIGMNNYRGDRLIRYSAVRYGNVLGSTGSVLDAFRSTDGAIPITDERMSRFWITPQQAARFVLSSLGIMRGGETFVPKLPSMRIVDMARAVAPEAELQTVGLRGPEKLQECLVSADESLWTVELPDRYVILPMMPFWAGSSWPEAKPVPQGWQYLSGQNECWLTAEQLRELVGLSTKEVVSAV